MTREAGRAGDLLLLAAAAVLSVLFVGWGVFHPVGFLWVAAGGLAAGVPLGVVAAVLARRRETDAPAPSEWLAPAVVDELEAAGPPDVPCICPVGACRVHPFTVIRSVRSWGQSW